jgi:type IV secretion system protein VirB10
MGAAGQLPSREDYTRQRLEEIARLTQNQGGAPERDNNRYTDAGRYNPENPPRGSASNYLNDDCLFPGTIIHAILVSRIDTDYPGPIHARVTENVYDSMTGKNLLIPQGTILQGNYSSSSIGVSKVQIAWESMVISYGGVAYQTMLGGMAGVDKRGRAGIAGTLDDHYFEWLKAAGIITFFSILNSEVMHQTQGASPQVREMMDINQGIVNRISDRLIERALDIQPTVRVANGAPVSVSVNTIVNLKPFPAVKAEEKWVRK